MNEDPKAITAYDIEHKRPIGVFKSCSVAARYLCPQADKTKIGMKIIHRARNRSRLKGSVLGTVAIRFANDAQKQDLSSGHGVFHIYEGYPEMSSTFIV